ncbi:MAG: hypothetical protein VX529_03120 [Pseudomonadota bacterium]|jgi:hypothetical protein|nr:hypothetical protein [Pseudomonadota bacterium]
MKKTVLIASVAALGLAAPVFAQDTTFADADTDMSGGLSLAEVQAIAPDVTSEGFDAYDADADGELNEDEFDTWKMANPEDSSEDASTDAEDSETETEPYNG